MVRSIVLKTKIITSVWVAKGGKRCAHNLAQRKETEKTRACKGKAKEEETWVPHPCNGIYYPKGHEWVMEDVSAGAASFTYTYWFRSTEGVENPTPDAPPGHPSF